MALTHRAHAWRNAHRIQPASQPARQPHWSAAVQRSVLENGLTVLLLQRGELPIVSVQALYRVGSRNEAPGITGIAHFVEHMAFRSTDGIAKADLTNQILRWGGRWNGYTSYDQTTYASQTPSQYLDWLIYLESQRMRHVRFSPDEVARERTSVIAELHQYENSPSYTLIDHRLRPAAFVAHPYGSPIMGWISDLNGLTADDIQRFYTDYYAPNNLVLVIVGRFDPPKALALVTEHFSHAAATGRSPRLRTVEPAQRGTRRITLAGPGAASHVEIAVHAPAATSDAFATLLAMNAVLAGGHDPGRSVATAGSRLYRALVHTGLATEVATEVEASEYPGLYSIGIDAGAHADLSKIEAAAGAVLDELGTSVTESEVAQAARDVRSAMVLAADGNGAIANLLAVYEGLGSYQLLSGLADRLAALDAAAVRTFAKAHLAEDQRTVGWFAPDERPSAAISPDEPTRPSTSPSSVEGSRLAEAVRADRPKPPRAEAVVPDFPVPVVRRLPDGIRLIAIHIPGDTVNMRVRIGAGAVHDPPGREGLALISARLAADALAERLAGTGVRLTRSAFDDEAPLANRHFVEIDATLLNEDAAAIVTRLAGLLGSDEISNESVSKAKRALSVDLEARADDSRWRARQALFQRLYPAGHPYARSIGGTAETLGRISRADVQMFRSQYVTADRTTVAIAGGIGAETALTLAARAFERSPTRAAPPALAMAPAAGTFDTFRAGGRVQVSLPHKEQSSIAVGLPGVRRSAPEYPALAALNYLLGETGYAGRLGETLVDTGIAYSAYSSVLAAEGPGPILIVTEAVNASEAVHRILSALAGLARGSISDADLAEAKGFLLGRLLFRFETPASATRALADTADLGRAADLTTFARAVTALTIRDVQAAGAKFCDPAKAVVAVAGR